LAAGQSESNRIKPNQTESRLIKVEYESTNSEEEDDEDEEEESSR
jgi:hypothetical protein